MSLLPKSVITKHLRPASGAKLVRWLADDNAKAVRRQRQAAKSGSSAAEQVVDDRVAAGSGDGGEAADGHSHGGLPRVE